MISFEARIEKYDQQGEKTGWTYVLIRAELAGVLLPGIKKSFRVKGRLDKYPLSQVALLPVGEGNFILPINGMMRKKIGKGKGDLLKVELQIDNKPLEQSAELLLCLKDEPLAYREFNKMPPSHQNYYTKWIESAKTPETKARRIAKTIQSLCQGKDFGEMLRDKTG